MCRTQNLNIQIDLNETVLRSYTYNMHMTLFYMQQHNYRLQITVLLVNEEGQMKICPRYTCYKYFVYMQA